MYALKNKNVYLSAPIEYNQESSWKDHVKKTLVEKFDLKVFDPSEDPKQQWWDDLNEAKIKKDYKRMSKIAKLFVRKDLGTIDRSDLVIAYIPHKVPTTGVVHEIINSNNAKKPTLLVTDCNDISFIPIWYYGFINIKFMFPNWNALFEYLKEVDDGKHKDNDRWSLIYGDV